MVWFGDGDLQRLAGAKSYERGIGYVGAVGDLDELPDGVVAIVHGTEPYRVRLRENGGSLDADCTCPHSQNGAFCKHCVAVRLVLLADAPAGLPKQRVPAKPKSVDLRGYLTSVDPAELVDLLLDLAADDPALHRRLSLRAATHGTPDVKELRRLVGSLRVRGFLDYSRSFGRRPAPRRRRLVQRQHRRPAAVGPATAKTYVGRLLTKLGVADRVHLVIHAYESGLIAPQPDR